MCLTTNYSAMYGDLNSDDLAKVGEFAVAVGEAVATDNGDQLLSLVKTAMDKLANDRQSFFRLIGALNYAETYGTPGEKIAVAKLLPVIKLAMKQLDAEHALSKQAEFPYKPVQLGLSALTTGLAAAPFIAHMAHKSGQEKKIKASLKAILNDHPELRDDPNTARYFQAIVDFAPDVASNALVAGNVMKTMHQIGPGSVTPKMISELLQVQKNYDDRPTTGKSLGEVGAGLARVDTGGGWKHRQ